MKSLNYNGVYIEVPVKPPVLVHSHSYFVRRLEAIKHGTKD